MAAAALEDVATALGRPLTESETDQADWWLTGVELLLRNRLGDLDVLDQDALRYVEAEAVAGKVRRAGITESSVTVSADDASVTRRWDSPVSAADITDEWWNLLDTDSSARTASIRPGFEPDNVAWSVSSPGYDRRYGWYW